MLERAAGTAASLDLDALEQRAARHRRRTSAQRALTGSAVALVIILLAASAIRLADPGPPAVVLDHDPAGSPLDVTPTANPLPPTPEVAVTSQIDPRSGVEVTEIPADGASADREPAAASPPSTEMLAILEQPPAVLSAGEAGMVAFGPTGRGPLWLAGEAENHRVLVAPRSDGDIASIAVAAMGAAGGNGLLTLNTSLRPDSWLVWSIVPDGYDTGVLADGRELPINNNLLSFAGPDGIPSELAGTGEVDIRGSVTGPAGSLPLRRAQPPTEDAAATFDVLDESEPPWPLVGGVDQLRPQNLWPTDQLRPLNSVVGTVESVVGSLAITSADQVEAIPPELAVTEGLCLTVLFTPPDPPPIGCGYARTTGTPLVATISWTGADGGLSWAALVPDGWTELVTSNGSSTPVRDNVLAIPDITTHPRTAELVNADGRREVVAVMPWEGDEPNNLEALASAPPGLPLTEEPEVIIPSHAPSPWLTATEQPALD
ncbi:hypothetical protein [Euzebya tangerina]|uniref:hypothetical protein n=1 Tax=Euzebya tangerina TaxID=591198 RepID=UPI000E31F6CB